MAILTVIKQKKCHSQEGTVAMKDYVVSRKFPLRHIQDGSVLGNSYLGVLVWGGKNKLNISLGCSALWDHRGGLEWTAEHSWENIQKTVYAGNMEAMRKLLQNPHKRPGQESPPVVVPAGRIEVKLKKNCILDEFQLHLIDARLAIYYTCSKKQRTASICLDMNNKRFLGLRCSDIASFKVLDSCTLSNGKLEKAGFAPPAHFKDSECCGFINELPADPAYGIAAKWHKNILSICFDRDDDPKTLRTRLASFRDFDWNETVKSNKLWWKKYWQDIPETRIDNPELEELYNYGLYKFGSMTDASGHPAGLQGPWIEDDNFPPWSGDYHFNINIEMCYWPAFRANRPENLKPVFKMITGILPSLRQNARYFAGINDGIMLPHATDDRGRCRGGFWTGTIDHACTAWMVQMMYDYCDYFSDMEYLRDTVFELMKGTMRVFEVMIKVLPDGRMQLPFSISPEYRGGALDAWGVNASFQLAAIHRLAENLISAARLLNEPEEPFWHEVLEKLPKVSIMQKEDDPDAEHELWQKSGGEIALWDGLVLKESHRHHSHLAAIVPFDTIDLDSPEYRQLIYNTMQRWIVNGMGQWAGWSMPWAAMLHTRFNGGKAAELMLELFKRNFTNPGGNSRHNTAFRAFSLMGSYSEDEIMQMDAAMGAVAAIQDMFVHRRRDTVYIGSGIPETWKNCGVKNMPAPGGFRISCNFTYGKCSRIGICATRDNLLTLKLPPPVKRWRLPENAGIVTADKITLQLKKDEKIILKSR